MASTHRFLDVLDRFKLRAAQSSCSRARLKAASTPSQSPRVGLSPLILANASLHKIVHPGFLREFQAKATLGQINRVLHCAGGRKGLVHLEVELCEATPHGLGDSVLLNRRRHKEMEMDHRHKLLP